MSRMVMAEEAHFVNIIPPFGSAAPTKDSDVFSMKDASHCTIMLQVGAQAGSFDVDLVACDDFTPSSTSAIGYKLAKEESAAGDTLDALADTASTGHSTSATNNIMYVMEVDAEDMPEGYPNLQLKLSGLDNTTYVSALAILTGLSYQGDQNRTQIA
jgi:hypothetical protein